MGYLVRPLLFIESVLTSTYSPELEVRLFEFDSYLDMALEGPPSLLSPTDVLSQASRIRLNYRPPRDSDDGAIEDEPEPIKIWATVGLTKVSSGSFIVVYSHMSIISGYNTYLRCFYLVQYSLLT